MAGVCCARVCCTCAAACARYTDCLAAEEKEEFEMICAEEGADEVSAFPFAFQFAAAQLKPAGG